MEADVFEVLQKGKVIEDYPTDQLYPSYLMLAFVKVKPLHVVVAMNSDNQSQIVITAYEPDPKSWETGFERRKK